MQRLGGGSIGSRVSSLVRRRLPSPKQRIVIMEGLKKGLIIKGEHCQEILKGLKTWEMRSRPTKYRGKFGLIVAGTKKVFGSAVLLKSPMIELDDQDSWHEAYLLHRVKEFKPQWPFPWVLGEITVFGEPIPYDHKNGCVTWVNL